MKEIELVYLIAELIASGTTYSELMRLLVMDHKLTRVQAMIVIAQAEARSIAVFDCAA